MYCAFVFLVSTVRITNKKHLFSVSQCLPHLLTHYFRVSSNQLVTAVFTETPEFQECKVEDKREEGPVQATPKDVRWRLREFKRQD